MAYTAVGANHNAIFKYWNWNSVRKRANSLMISDFCFLSASCQVSFCSWRRVSKLFIMDLVAIMCHWPSKQTAGIYNPWFLQSSKTDSIIFLIKTSDVQLYHFGNQSTGDHRNEWFPYHLRAIQKIIRNTTDVWLVYFSKHYHKFELKWGNERKKIN